jgi:hypothetical protein
VARLRHGDGDDDPAEDLTTMLEVLERTKSSVRGRWSQSRSQVIRKQVNDVLGAIGPTLVKLWPSM